MLIDTHTHLQLVNYDQDREAVIQRAMESGVERMINVSFDIPSSLASLSLSKKYPFMNASIGVHPHDAKDFNPTALLELRRLVSSKEVVAIGEIGLDYYRNLSPREVQLDSFRQQLILAKELSLPVIFHTREAYSDLLQIVKEEGISRGVLHCFSGVSEDVKKGLELGLYFGIGGMVTYKSSNLSLLLKEIPQDRLLLETDCPFVTPRPHNGRNEPAYLTTICQRVSDILELSYEEVAIQTTKNAEALFNLNL